MNDKDRIKELEAILEKKDSAMLAIRKQNLLIREESTFKDVAQIRKEAKELGVKLNYFFRPEEIQKMKQQTH